jgi:DNA repair exonuclease SbcCD ATPase subunit
MANEPPRLTTADLRRRLHASVANGPVGAEPAPQAVARPSSLPRLTTPPSATYVSESEEGLPGLDDLLSPPPAEASPIIPARPAAPEYARPAGRSSHYLRRPTLPPMAEPVAPRYSDAEQFRIDADQLRREKQHLEQLMEEMRQLLQEASEQEQRVQAELKEREGRLATAGTRIAELETIINTKPKTKSELEEWADELERDSFKIAQERRVMEDERKQLREDEAVLEKQMREMEVQMARERAILARQEQELRRLNSEIQHELEMMQRGDGSLRERMQIFQRRHAEVVGGAPPTSNGTYAGLTQSPVATANPTPTPKKNDTTGLLRKLFRGGE